MGPRRTSSGHLTLVCRLGLLLCLAAVGCVAAPLPQVVYVSAIYPQSRYPTSAEAEGIAVAVVPFAPGRDVYGDPTLPERGRDPRSLNVLDAGMLPVRVIVWNNSREEIVLDPEQIMGLADGVAYRPHSPSDAVAVVTGSDEFKNAIKGSQIGPVLQSFLGGEMIGEALRGGVRGVASGGVTGGASGMAAGATGAGLSRARGYEKSLVQLITAEYTDRAITRRTVYPGFTVDGLIFLPSRVGITRLEIRVYAPGSQQTIRLETELR